MLAFIAVQTVGDFDMLNNVPGCPRVTSQGMPLE